MANKKTDVLVVYKDDVLKELISSSLSDMAAESNVQYHSYNEQGIEVLKNTKCDFVFLQIVDVVKQANQLLELIRSVANKSYIICISDTTNEDTESHLTEAGVKAVLPSSLIVPRVVNLLFKNYQTEAEIKSALQFSTTNKGDDFITREIFLMGISHEIRTPLNSIIGFTNLLLKNETDEKQLEYLQAVKKSGEKIQALMENLVAVSASSTSQTDFKSTAENPEYKIINFNELKKLKILVVEDDYLNLKLITHLFSDYGITPDVAENGKIAIEALQKKEYNLILMDMEMPVMDGYEATGYIRKTLKSRVPIIAMTAHAMPGERERCLRHGMNDYLTKPVNVNLLFEKIYKSMPQSKHEIKNKEVKTHVTDLSYLKSTMSGNKEAIKEMILFFQKHVPVYLEEINKAILQSDFQTISKVAHKTKSAVAIMGIKSLETDLFKIESLSKEGAEIDRIKLIFQLVNDICNEAFKEIEIEQMKYI
jgi:CheY-like chemotaxis protein